MTSIIFARPRHVYKTYEDLYRLIELSRFPLVYLDEVNWQRDQTVIAVVKHPEWSCIPAAKTSRLIWWSFERMLHVDEFDMASPVVPAGVDEAWTSDRAIAAAYGFRYVFLGGVDTFARVRVLDKPWDIVTLMYFSGRRQALIHDLRTFRWADERGGAWDEERANRLNGSRLMLSAHQDEQPWSEPIRFALAAMYCVPLLSETCADSGYWEAGRHYLSAPFADLVSVARAVLTNNLLLAQIAANAWRLVCRERPFRKSVLEALGQAVVA